MEIPPIAYHVIKKHVSSSQTEWFEVITELKACKICQQFNGKIFKVSELVPALNAPPFHPNCRCTTVPHFRKGTSKTTTDILFEERLPKVA